MLTRPLLIPDPDPPEKEKDAGRLRREADIPHNAVSKK